MNDPFVPHCGCEDCEAAVSPGAYLASLLDYVLKHVRNNGAKIDLAFLEANFHQPFSDLPIDCEASDKKVRQVRLAVEILRDYIGPRPMFEPSRELSLSRIEEDYRLAAYTRLLTLLGTTYEELRRARSPVEADRRALAERLGIDLTPNPVGPRLDELDRLILDASLPAADARALTEQVLERTFGLGDTTRDRLSEGVKYGDAQQQITRWNFNGAYWSRNTDANGFIYLDLFKLAADSYAVRAFTDEARSLVVASGERKTATGSVRLVPANGSGLTGIVEIDYVADDTGISLSLLPSLLVWRLRHMRVLWDGEDWPAEGPAADATQLLRPLIDPQVIGLNDLRSPRPGDTAYDLWLARVKWLEGQRTTLKTTYEAAASPLAGLEAIISLALSTPVHAVTAAYLDEIKQAQVRGERIEQRLSLLGLTPSAFAFLLPILGLARDGQPITSPEWEVVYDTLLNARKQHEWAAWRTEEHGLKLTLSPSHFRLSDGSGAPAQAISLSVPLWLSTRETRQAWIDVLEARVAQEATIVSGLDSAVSSVEELTLPLLRDALLEAADLEGVSLPDRAEWLTQQLLMDFRMSGQQITTRIAQAIETLQELLFGLRSGELDQDVRLASAPLESIYAVAQGENRIDLFGRGRDDVLWHRVWDGRWRVWRSLGTLPGTGVGSRPSDPVIVARSAGRLDLVVRGTDRVVWHRYYDQGWSDWLRVEGDLELEGNLAIALRGPDQIDVFALRIADLEVMQRHYNGTNWTAWEATGISSSRSPAAASWAADRLDLLLGRRAPDLFKPLHRWWNGAGWQDEPLDNTLFGNPALVSWGANRLDVFQNFNGHLWQKTWDGAWQPWVDLDAALPAGFPALKYVPSVCSRGPGRLDGFAIRSSGLKTDVWLRRFEGGAWSDWQALLSNHLELDAPDFDTEWEWMGSYATWRSAMFVRLYPENLLHPSLITHQTPAFTKLVEETRPTRRLTPEKACELWRAYANYLGEVVSLEISATCEVYTEVTKKATCKTSAHIYRYLLYMFGRTTFGNIYWSAIDPEDRSGYAQSFWDEIPLAPKDGKPPALKVEKIIGALPWLDRRIGQHYIYLFLVVDELGERKLMRIRFDLDSYSWESEPLEISGLHVVNGKQMTAGDVTILPVQSDSYQEAPRLAVYDPWSKNVFIRPLNTSGDGWEPSPEAWAPWQQALAKELGDWWNFRIVPRQRSAAGAPMKVDDLEAALRVNKVDWIVFWHYISEAQGSLRAAFANVPGRGYGQVSAMSPFEQRSRLYGTLPGSFLGSSIFVFYEEKGRILYQEMKKDNSNPTENWPERGTVFVAGQSVGRLACGSGSFTPRFFVTPHIDGHSYAHKFQIQNGELIGSAKFDVIPMLSSSPNLLAGQSVVSLQSQRTIIESVYQKHKGVSASILTYLTEAYRLVPQQLALSLQAAGEYVAALDWLTTVYDYRAPQGRRYIDYGLAIDAGLPETDIYRHPEDWLLDPLNPHAVALTRRFAYTRFAIASIIRCLNDFADAEFTYDTSESLVHARLLYTTALELCDVPELREGLDACAALIGELKIKPGELVPPEVVAALGEIADELTQGKAYSSPRGWSILEKMKSVVMSAHDWSEILPELKELKAAAIMTVPMPFKVETAVAERSAMSAKAYSGLLTDPSIEKMAKRAGEIAIAAASNWLDEIEEIHQ